MAAGPTKPNSRVRLLQFLILEAVALAILAISLFGGIGSQVSAEWALAVFRILPIAAAIAATALPILYYGRPTPAARNSPTRPAR